jgi:tetratricopeptide (TPR) repeat protein
MLLLSSCGITKKRVLSPTEMDVANQRHDISGKGQTEAIAAPGLTPIGLDQPSDDSSREQKGSGLSGEKSFFPNQEYIKGRVFEYGRKLDRWKELDNQTLVTDLDTEASEEMLRCFRELQKVLNGYNRIHESLQRQDFLGSVDPISGSEMMKLEQWDIAFLESSCGRVLGGSGDSGEGWQQYGKQDKQVQIETLIDLASENSEFEEVIQIWQQVPENQLDTLSLKSRISYGNALMSLHQGEEAATVYLDIIDRMTSSDNQSIDILSLRKILADLYTASGNYDKAEEQYRKISYDYSVLGQIEGWATLQLSILEKGDAGDQELLEYSELLRNSLGFIPQRDGYKLLWQSDKFLADYPSSSVSANVDIIKSSAQSRADQWFVEFLTEVDGLAEEERFQDALLLLGTLQEDILSGESLIELRRKSDDLTLAVAVSSETRKLEKMRVLEQQWNDALLLIDRGAYDEAIESLTTLLDTEYAVRADNKIAEASLLAARAERRRAADLFIQFTKATDVESRKKLLVESRRCLTDILIKYPDVGITDKVMGNIKRVEKEMNAIDPMLISQSELVGEEQSNTEEDSLLQLMETIHDSSQPKGLQEQNIE